MNLSLLLIYCFIICTHSAKQKHVTPNKTVPVPEAKKVEENKPEERKAQNKVNPKDIPDLLSKLPRKKIIQLIQPEAVTQWAKEISESLLENEELVVQSKEIIAGFSNIRIAARNGSAIVEQMARNLEDLLTRRVKAAEAIMRRAEALASEERHPPPDYTYDYSIELNELKKKLETESQWDLPEHCRSLRKLHLRRSEHFDADVSLDHSSVHAAAEVFDCNPIIKNHLYWSEGLLSTFKDNYAQDASMDFQYFCSARGFLRHYPAALWSSLFQLPLETDNVYDCRLRPWYVSANGAPRDILILLDASGSMDNSSNQVTAEWFTQTLLNALPDDDQVNVLRFNVIVKSPISCFDDKLVPADHVNTAAMMSELKELPFKNETKMDYVLRYAIRLLQRQKPTVDRPVSCQQAIVVVTDSLYHNYTELLRELDPTGRIRLFVMWLHDQYGLRDNTREYSNYISCDRDGYFAELLSSNDVTEQVMNIMRVLERPLVAQRKERLQVYSDVYAHVEEPRRSEFYWLQKENAEQVYRYRELRKNKEKLLNDTYKHYLHQQSLDKYGLYYEGQDVNYRLQISVSVPVFDHTTLENITIKLDEENQRNATRTLGPGGVLFVIDHRGNIVLHDNLKPVFDGDLLKPGYRTVDIINLEQPAKEHAPRDYPEKWLEFRHSLVIQHPRGIRVMHGKNVYEEGMRASLEQREYHWKRVTDHYVVAVVLPPYGRYHAVPEGQFTQQIAQEALKTLTRSDFAVNPDWLYCKHVEPHFDTPEAEVLHFIRRRSDEPNFAMKKLKHLFSPLEPALLDKTYQCNEELIARLCREAVATSKWMEDHEDLECTTCKLGSVTAFFSSESGLTRWRHYHITSPHAPPPSGGAWPHGPAEPWYRRAVAAGAAELLVHAPVTPVRRMRNTEAKPPEVGTRGEWLTAARVVGSDKGVIGVAGFHFHPQHFEDLLVAVTYDPCDDKDEDCKPTCDGKIWSCVIIDEGGWIAAGGPSPADEDNPSSEDPIRLHLATAYPTAMAALVKAKIFTVNWLHDYQGVCFNYEESSASMVLPTLLKSIWRSVYLLITVAQELVTLVAVFSSSNTAYADTQKERDKRRNRVRRDFEREKYDRLYDERVLVNRSRFAACDRSRPMYELQRTPQTMEYLRRGASLCSWPLVGAPVPGTNLLLLAIYTRCRYHEDPVHDPLVNKPVDVDKLMGDQNWGKMSKASRLACFRNRVPLLGRPPRVTCFQHNYTEEEGYRQCGPWLPDPEPEEESTGSTSNARHQLSVLLKLLFLFTLFTYV
ncbi:voltage-dependent calcium channel subunit alpha-2/delta-3-like isoform X2 [Ostrinia furnacalis]|uniref:voltage-dependent calcium channel subunit alpha-2/delta-3-like isoform X2 n=1 Tax=Ostrinia furnacalis TaxID=93504 RepID=UPI00103D662A|nr:voltage-dependent calcium channel subunit alpha-2/delta-3-like isoform X2 [Ostrinia furnacalis]